MDMESLTGPQAIKKAVTTMFEQKPLPTATIVHFKVSTQGITLTDNARKLFFRRHYPTNNISYCGLDTEERTWDFASEETGRPVSAQYVFFLLYIWKLLFKFLKFNSLQKIISSVIDRDISSFQSLFRIRCQETGAQIGQPVSRVRRARTGTTSHGHSEFREQGHDGQLHSEGQHRVNRFIHLTRPPRCLDNGFSSSRPDKNR